MDIKKQRISPFVAMVIILVVIAIAGVLIYRYSGPPAHSGMTPEMAKQLNKMFGNGAPGSGGDQQSPYANMAEGQGKQH